MPDNATAPSAVVRRAAFVGFGAMGEQVARLARMSMTYTEEIFFDDHFLAAGGAGARPFADHVSDEFAGCDFFVCLGYHHAALRRRLMRQLVSLGRRLPVVAHPSASLDPSATIGAGCIFLPGAIVDANAIIGMGTLLHNGAIVSHDSHIGECAYLSPRATVCGRVRIGAECFLGAGVLVANDLAVEDRCILGIGTVVTRSITDAGTHWIGNPMRRVERGLKL
ncbi:MAG: acetyltransferase [Verrucomicrobiaceae bacterium]|nr:acetyltransferase [Verrucomicrobiaceae bacterium]